MMMMNWCLWKVRELISFAEIAVQIDGILIYCRPVILLCGCRFAYGVFLDAVLYQTAMPRPDEIDRLDPLARDLGSTVPLPLLTRGILSVLCCVAERLPTLKRGARPRRRADCEATVACKNNAIEKSFQYLFSKIYLLYHKNYWNKLFQNRQKDEQL